MDSVKWYGFGIEGMEKDPTPHEYGDMPTGWWARLKSFLGKLHYDKPEPPASLVKSRECATTIKDIRNTPLDEMTVERRLTCGHDDWHEVEASLRSVWCRECQDMVECEFRELDGTPINH